MQDQVQLWPYWRSTAYLKQIANQVRSCLFLLLIFDQLVSQARVSLCLCACVYVCVCARARARACVCSNDSRSLQVAVVRRLELMSRWGVRHWHVHYPSVLTVYIFMLYGSACREGRTRPLRTCRRMVWPSVHNPLQTEPQTHQFTCCVAASQRKQP